MEEDKDIGAIFIGVLGTALFGIVLWLTRHIDHPTEQQAAVSQVSVPREASLQQSYSVASAEATAAPSHQVFECVVNGQHVYSDYPCDTTRQTRNVTPQNVYATTTTMYPESPDANYSTPQTRRGEEAMKPTEDCSEFETSVKRIDERMRHGYGEPEGEMLRGQRRQAATARDDCKRHNRVR